METNYDLLFDEYKKLQSDYEDLLAFTRKVLKTSENKELKAELLLLLNK